MLGVFGEVSGVHMRVFLPWHDSRDRPVQPVHPRNELVELGREFVAFLCVFPETTDDLVFVNVVELLEVLILVEILKQLALRRVT